MNRDNILNNLKDNISVNKFRKENAKKEKIKNIAQSIFTVLLCTASITGIVFAKNISTMVYENFWETGNGIGHAMQEGYIEEPEMEEQKATAIMENEETGEFIEDLETSVKVDEFVMDDFNLSITFNVTLSDKFLEIAKAEDIWGMDFTDMVIKDENDYIVYHGTEKYKEFDIEDEKVINTGINSFLQQRKGNTLKVIYNIYTDSNHFPKSKKLNVEFTKINMSKEDSVATIFGDGEYTFKGNWSFSIDVPEKMYNRATIPYTQKSSTSKDVKVTSATVYETGMDISLEAKNVSKNPEMPTNLEIEFYESLPKDSEFKSDNSQIGPYIYSKLYNTKEYQEYMEEVRNLNDIEIYLLNDNDEKFELTQGPRANGSRYTNEEGILICNGMYDLTKYDVTDTIRVVVNKNGEENTITLVREEE